MRGSDGKDGLCLSVTFFLSCMNFICDIDVSFSFIDEHSPVQIVWFMEDAHTGNSPICGNVLLKSLALQIKLVDLFNG